MALALVLYHEAKKDLLDDLEPVPAKPFCHHRIWRTQNPSGEQVFHDLWPTTIGQLTEAKVHRAALGALLLSLFPLVEGIGLLFRVSWAGWLAIGESIFFIPFEFYALVNTEMAKPDTFPWSIFAVMVINIIIVWYLYENREVLFRHHHRHHRQPGGSYMDGRK